MVNSDWQSLFLFCFVPIKKDKRNVHDLNMTIRVLHMAGQPRPSFCYTIADISKRMPITEMTQLDHSRGTEVLCFFLSERVSPIHFLFRPWWVSLFWPDGFWFQTYQPQVIDRENWEPATRMPLKVYGPLDGRCELPHERMAKLVTQQLGRQKFQWRCCFTHFHTIDRRQWKFRANLTPIVEKSIALYSL